MRKSKEVRVKQIEEKRLLSNQLNIQLFAGPTGATKISDVVVPQIFAGYMNKEPLELNAFYQSGVMVRNSEFDGLVTRGGFTFTMPYWDELEGEYEERTDSDTGLPNFNKITAKYEVAVKLFDKYTAGSSQLASELAGADAIKAIRQKFNHKISNLDQKRILSLLKGVFSSAEMQSNILDITTRTGTAQNFGVTTVIEGQGLLGDRQKNLAAIAVHSTTYTYLKMKNLISSIKQSEQGQEIEVYAGKRIIIDDALVPTADGVYTTYLFTSGSIAYGRGGEKYPVESGKIPFMEEEGILVRKNHTFHIRGTKWDGKTDGMCTVEELEKGDNWKKVYSHKQIPVVLIKHKVDLTEFTTSPKSGAEEIGKAIATALSGAIPQNIVIENSITEETNVAPETKGKGKDKNE
ncbi:hypothetical protein H3N56_03070 [Cetobacterium sp. 2A]|uniref:major capsid protein n=1 Tax=Cetobacterium sp. 2A TaxID=2754723 RepID=UPI00163B938B|nr:major capsid protein [Cetobacterium sp. 2A]MBC2855476.1 hypothetical protein [Cetobacterium sp. 2A]